MIKAGGRTADNRPLLVIGLSRKNVERLLDNQPIRFAGDALGVACEVLILGGETEDDIAEDLRSLGPISDPSQGVAEATYGRVADGNAPSEPST